MYTERLKKILTPAERKLFSRLDSPAKIQDFLDSLPINFETRGETYMSPRRMLKARTAHCFEGALLAAAALAYHGQRPLLMDLRTAPPDEDHVITLFNRNGFWGAISKTNHPVLRYRDAVYATPRELAMSYFHEYFDKKGKKTLREYSRPYDLTKFAPEKWLTDDEDLVWLVNALDDSRHFPIVPKKNLRSIRKATRYEIRAMAVTEWNSKGAKGS
jgi:hypothetical protein